MCPTKRCMLRSWPWRGKGVLLIEVNAINIVCSTFGGFLYF